MARKREVLPPAGVISGGGYLRTRGISRPVAVGAMGV